MKTPISMPKPSDESYGAYSAALASGVTWRRQFISGWMRSPKIPVSLMSSSKVYSTPVRWRRPYRPGRDARHR
jgi:hypothetical protein